ncbi:MAG TPA: sensor domain-containing diguanylate cyclase [Allosphingosinicella sp.]|jgi:diguanylate cyclase (GGDEF)-like protein
MADGKLVDEPARLAALHRYGVLDSSPEEPFDRITSLVAAVLQVPMCAVSLVDSQRQWFKSGHGLDARETPRSVAFCDHTIRTRTPLVVPDAREDERFAANPLVTGGPGVVSYAGVPLVSPDGYNLGALCAIDTRPRAFSTGEIDILKKFAALVVDELELRTIVARDALTGALTRRAFLEAMRSEMARGHRHKRDCALVLLDIDHFKSVNDTHGHPAGDDVLRRAVGACADTLRPSDSLGRIGGEEFAVLLPESDEGSAAACAERLRAAIERLDFPSLGGRKVTASFGVANLPPAGLSEEQWLAEADAALYAAKRRGRNCCVASAELYERSAA